MMHESQEQEIQREMINEADCEAAQHFLEKRYKEAGVDQRIVQANLDHTAQVRHYARILAEREGVDVKKAELAAICHDCGKLGHDHQGGIDTFGHHETGARATQNFLAKDRGKSVQVTDEITNAVARHSRIPFIERVVRSRFKDVPQDEQEKKLDETLPAPKETLDFVLRDADMMGMLEVQTGLRKIVEIRQNPASPFYKEDGGDLWKAIASYAKSAEEAYDILHTKTAKTIGDTLRKDVARFIAAVHKQGIATLEDFRAACDAWEQERKKGAAA